MFDNVPINLADLSEYTHRQQLIDLGFQKNKFCFTDLFEFRDAELTEMLKMNKTSILSRDVDNLLGIGLAIKKLELLIQHFDRG